MQLNLSDEQLQQVISGAIVQTLSSENREKLLKDAIANLLVPVKNDYGRQPASSPLQDAFKSAVYQFTQQRVKEMLETDESFKALLGSVLQEGIQKALVTDRDTTVFNIAHSVSDFIKIGGR